MCRAAAKVAYRRSTSLTRHVSCVQARVNAGPVRDVPCCSLDAEGPIVDPPAISGELETGLCDDVGIGHHVWHHSRVQLPQFCSVPVKTGQPGEDVADCPQLSFRLQGVAAMAVGRVAFSSVARRAA